MQEEKSPQIPQELDTPKEYQVKEFQDNYVWRVILEIISNKLNTLTHEYDGAETLEQVRYIQGSRDCLHFVKNLPTVLMNEAKAMSEERNQEND